MSIDAEFFLRERTSSWWHSMIESTSGILREEKNSDVVDSCTVVSPMSHDFALPILPPSARLNSWSHQHNCDCKKENLNMNKNNYKNANFLFWYATTNTSVISTRCLSHFFYLQNSTSTVYSIRSSKHQTTTNRKTKTISSWPKLPSGKPPLSYRSVGQLLISLCLSLALERLTAPTKCDCESSFFNRPTYLKSWQVTTC